MKTLRGLWAVLPMSVCCLAACRSRGTAEDAAPAAAASPAVAAPASSSDAGRCALYWREAQLDISFSEEPRLEAEYDTGAFERQLRVTGQQRAAYRQRDRQTSVLEFESPKTKGKLDLQLVVPWSLKPLEGQQLKWQNHRKYGDCPGAKQAEPMLVAEDVLRDEQGKLVFLGVLSAPVSPTRTVTLAPGLTPELELGWSDVGCQVVPGPGGAQLLPVALEVKAGGRSWTAPVGQRTEVELGGTAYVLAVSAAATRADGACHSASFMLYRKDALERLAAPGTEG